MKLQRIQKYCLANPLQAWLFTTAFLLVFNLSLYFAFPGEKKSALIFMFVVMTFSSPTGQLLRRMSDEARRKHPVPPQQEQSIGLLALLFAIVSIGSLMLPMFRKRLHIPISFEMGIGLLMTFSISLLLSIALGYAARYSKAGRCALYISMVWLVPLLLFSLFSLVFLRK